jgi:hypothetical protein
LSPDNAVSEIVGFKEFISGGAGRTAVIKLNYVHSDDALHEELFV